MNESSNKRTVIVGTFIFVGLIFLVAGILMVGNLRNTFKKKMPIVAHFEDVGGLQSGNNVWFSGVKIGIVTDLHFYGTSQVEVTMKIETKAQQYIRKDAKIKLSTDGLIGNKILVIYGGTSAAMEIQEGDTLEVEKTFSSEDMINTLQDNNKNLLAITADFKTISKKIANGEGTIGKLLDDDAIYENINATTASLQNASAKANQLMNSLATFGEGLNTKGTLANELTTDTVVFNSLKETVMQLQQIADTATVFISTLNEAGSNPNTAIGVLMHDEAAGANVKETLKNLETSSKKLDEDLEALQHNFLLRGFFKDRDKAAKKDSIKTSKGRN